MYRVPQRLYCWWRGLDKHSRVQASLLFLVGLLGLAHYLLFCIPQQFYIEDAGISFAYARNLVEGEGLVTYPGGERVEGYSNPTWTFLVALFYAMGVPPWTSAKVMGAVFGFLTLPLVYGTARRALRGRADLELQSEDSRAWGRRQDKMALIAPMLLALSPQFAIWNSSGLENSLFCLLLAAGTFRVVQEGQEPERRPWSALCFALLAMTRPEGIVYAAIGFLAVVLGGLEFRNWKRPLVWLVVLLVPWGLYQWWRYSYFAWTWPNTYYAKLGKGTTFEPFGWPEDSEGGLNTRGWKYVLGYFGSHNIVYFFPFLALAMSGWKLWSARLNGALQRTRSRRWQVWSQLVGLLGVLVMIDAVFQPWVSGGQVHASLFGATLHESGEVVILGFSRKEGLVALGLGILAGVLLARNRLVGAAAVGMGGLVWAGLSVGHFIAQNAASEGNGGMEPGVGTLVFAFGSTWVLTAAGGLHRWRSSLAAWVLMAVSIVLLWDGPIGVERPFYIPDGVWPESSQDWVETRVWTLAGAVVVLGVVTLTHRGWRARGVLWASMIFGIFFALYSGGDWMKQHRWFSLVSVSLMPLIAIGVATVLEALVWLQQRISIERILPRHLYVVFPLVLALTGLSWVLLPLPVFVVLVSLLVTLVAWRALGHGPLLPTLPRFARVALAPSLVLVLVLLYTYGKGEISVHSQAFAKKPETGVRDINRRVNYMAWVQRRMGIDDITLLDVDMGAHMYYSGWDIVDIAGLVDVPMARHSDFNKSFISEYIFGERNPDFAHVHGGWARTSKIPTHPEWKERYLEIPGYPLGKGKCKDKKYKGETCTNLHVGNHVRKDLFVDAGQQLGEEVVRFGNDVSLVHLEIPSPEVATGARLYIDSSWHRPMPNKSKKGELGFRIVAILDDGQGNRASAVLPPGYDWYKPGWEEDEVVHGRYRMYIPRTLPHGEYNFSLAVLDEKSGKVLAVDEAHAVQDPGFVQGEWSSGVQVGIISSDAAYELARADLRLAMDTIRDGQCEDGWDLWKNAERHVMKREDWRERQGERVREAIAGCWIEASKNLGDRDELLKGLLRARHWDHRHPDLAMPSKTLAAQLDEEGDGAWVSGDIEGAFSLWSSSIALDPSRSWTRRKTEEARDRRLCIIRPGRNEAPSLSALSVVVSPPGKEALSATQKLVGITQIQVWDPETDEMIRCKMERATRMTTRSKPDAVLFSDFDHVDSNQVHLSDEKASKALDEEILQMEHKAIKGVKVGFRWVSALDDGTPAGVELVWNQASKRLGFVIRDAALREIEEWQSLLKPAVEAVIGEVNESKSSYRYKVIEGPSLDGAESTINQKGRLSYRGPEGVDSVQDWVTIEVTDSGSPKQRVEISVPVSSSETDETEIFSDADSSELGCSSVSRLNGWAGLISLFALLGWRRRA